MKWNKALALLLTGTMVLGLAACGTPKPAEPSTTPAAGIFAPGTYEGKAAGMNGDVAVSVTFAADEITAVVVGTHQETADISDPAIGGMPAAILAAQSTQVDVISGATMTSNGIIGAVNAAIVLAGADPAALKPIAAPDKPSAEVVKVETDVIVVGGGLAGLSAAIKAAQGGARVALVEKTAALGGSSALSGGGLGAVNSSVQTENGVTDSAADWLALWKERQATSPEPGNYPDWTLVEELINYSATSIEWLRSLGYEFRPPEGFGVDPVKRLHFPSPEGSGAVLTGFLGDKAAELGVEILLDTRAVELVKTGDAVTGVKAEGKNGPVELNGKAVILASGGFSRSEELNARFTPEVANYVSYSVSGAGNTGDGILMAEAVGAVPYEDPWHIGLGLTSPVKALNGFYWYGNYIFVNSEGNRFTNEAGHYAIVYNDAAYKAPDGAFMVFDSSETFAAYAAAAEGAPESADLFKGETVEELAGKIGVDPANLTATLAAYGKGNDAFGKADQLCAPMSVGPFYAGRFYPCSMGTFGGVKVDGRQNAVDATGAVIPGLYAAGEMANRPYYSQVYMSGSALQVATTTGQFAGEAAAEYVKR